MTPEEQSYRDMWLAECWRTVPEWHEPAVDKAVHNERNALLRPPVEDVAECA